MILFNESVACRAGRRIGPHAKRTVAPGTDRRGERGSAALAPAAQRLQQALELRRRLGAEGEPFPGSGMGKGKLPGMEGLGAQSPGTVLDAINRIAAHGMADVAQIGRAHV